MAESRDKPELADSDIEEADIEALARSRLKPGETILGEGRDESGEQKKAESRGICNAPLLLQKMQEIEYKVPDGAKRVPWVDSLAIDGMEALPKGVTAKDGVKLESTFLGIAGGAVKEAYRRLRVMKVPCSRPSDFYAEMLKTDKQMYMVRQRAAEEQRRIKIVDDRRKSQAAKKFEKKAKTKKLEKKAEDKRQNLEDIAKWRAKSKNDKDADDEQDLEDILDKRQPKQKGGPAVKSKKRQAADKKYGFGGKKKFAKSNDRGSTDDFSASPWSKKGKGKGKGKGGKGKGKGKGKGGGGGAPQQGSKRGNDGGGGQGKGSGKKRKKA